MITKEDVQNIVSEATDTILEGVDNLVSNLSTKDDLKRVECKVDQLSVKVDKLEDTVDGIKADISTVPSREEVNRLKSRMDKFALS